jgi:pimeloyl-ACP methyl ester carboxylesterase
MNVAISERCVVDWPVEPGSDLVAPITCVTAGFENGIKGEADSPFIVWLTGFGEGETAAAAAASQLHQQSQLPVVGAVLPFKKVVATASNLQRGLDYLIADAPHAVAAAIAPEQAVYLGGDSRGGGVASVAAGTGGAACKALGLLSPLIANRSLGETDSARARAIGWRLGVRTALQQNAREAANRRVTQGVLGEWRAMARCGRFMAALRYALSDEIETKALNGVQALETQGRPWRVFVAEQDACFPIDSYRRAFGSVACKESFQLVPGPHAGMESRAGQDQLQHVGRWFGSLSQAS